MRLILFVVIFFHIASCTLNNGQSGTVKTKNNADATTIVSHGIGESLIKLQEENKLMYGYAYQHADSILLDSLKYLVTENINFFDSIRNIIHENALGDGDMEITNKLMLEQGNALRVKFRLIACEDFMGRYLEMDIMLLDTYYANQTNKTWEQYCFDKVPAIAVNTILIKFETDILFAEHSLLNYWLEEK